jgi:rubrerythrin
MFIAEVTLASKVSEVESLTYDYYFKHVKPNPNNKLEDKKGWVCKICGFIYEGDPLPSDYICPICKHGASDFEKLK